MRVRRTWIVAVGSAFILVVALTAAAQDACSAPDVDAAWALPRTGAALGTGGMALAAARSDVTKGGSDAAPAKCIREHVPPDTEKLIELARPQPETTVAWMRPRSISAFGFEFISAPEGSVIRWR